jgi:hypothetical protein
MRGGKETCPLKILQEKQKNWLENKKLPVL